MIDKVNAVKTVLERAARLGLGQAMDLRTYKRNRSVVIVRTGEDLFEVRENGFFEERFVTDIKGLRKLMKLLLKREFPRSAKIRIYGLDEDSATPPERKKI